METVSQEIANEDASPPPKEEDDDEPSSWQLRFKIEDLAKKEDIEGILELLESWPHRDESWTCWISLPVAKISTIAIPVSCAVRQKFWLTTVWLTTLF